jgi:hypothetical protein
MVPRVDCIIGFEDLTLFIDEVTDAPRIPGFGVVTRTIGETYSSGSIAEQRKGEIKFLSEGGVLGDRVKADAKNFNVACVKVVDLVAEPATFSGSSRGVGFGVKPQQYFLST